MQLKPLMKELLFIRRLKAATIDVMALPQCSNKVLNDAVSDTTGGDSSNWLSTSSIIYSTLSLPL
jgi:hypothetical protein